MIDGMLAIDAHCHVGEAKRERHGLRSFGADELIARMDQNGIDKAVIQHLVFPLWEPEDFKQGNNRVVEAAFSYPDRLRGLALVNPKHGRFAEQEVRRCLEAGLKGIKLQPVLHAYPIDGELLDPLMNVAARANVPVVTHSDFNAKTCTPYQVARLAARWPQVTIVMLHMGIDLEMMDQVPSILKAVPNVVVETSQTHDHPYTVYVHTARRLGADRVLFGSDGPALSLEVALTKLAMAEQRHGLTKEEKAKILGLNAARVFGFK